MNAALKEAQTKLRHVSTTTLKDLKKNLTEKINEVEILKGKIRTRDKQLKTKDNEIGNMDKQVKRMRAGSDAHLPLPKKSRAGK